MARYAQIDKRASINSGGDKLRRFLTRTFRGELFVGLWVVLRNMFKRGGSHTLRYPMEKFVMPPRYRGVHKLMRLLESGSERCIGCGLCEKICVANCIAMETSLGSDGRKKVDNYSINLGRCVYCGLCADVCPEIAIVHGCEYELASEQRAYYGFKEDLLIRGENLCLNGAAQEFTGYGSLDENAGARIKMTPNAYIKSAAESSKKEGAASDKILFSGGAGLSGENLAERQYVGRASIKESSAADAERSKENSVTDAQNFAPDSQRNSKENRVSQSAEDSATDSKNFKENFVAPHAENSTGGLAADGDSAENSKENSAMQDAGSSTARGKKSKANSKKNSAADAENSTQSSAPDSATQGEEQ